MLYLFYASKYLLILGFVQTIFLSNLNRKMISNTTNIDICIPIRIAIHIETYD